MRKRTLEVLDKSSDGGKPAVRQRNIAPKGRDLRNDVQEFKRELILGAAIDVFFEKGYQSATVDEIAAAMSVSKAVVYWNFASKLEVLDAIVDRALAKVSHCVTCIDHDRRAAQNLAQICFNHASIILANQKEIAVYIFERRNVSDALKRKITSQRDLLVDALGQVLERGVEAGEFAVKDYALVAYDIISMTTMTFDWRWHHDIQRYSLENLSAHFAEQALRLAGYVGPFPFADGELTVDTPASR